MPWRRMLHMIEMVLLNRLLLILVILMIASIFSVLLIKGTLFTDRQGNVELDNQLKFAKFRQSPLDRRLAVNVGQLFVNVAVKERLFKDHA
jgi:hypothetical protein